MTKKAKPPPNERTCGNCRHWKDITEEGAEERVGECRRAPPQVLYDPEDGAFGMWPFVTSSDWCGEHSPVLQ